MDAAGANEDAAGVNPQTERSLCCGEDGSAGDPDIVRFCFCANQNLFPQPDCKCAEPDGC